jgi:hypothetical protein
VGIRDIAEIKYITKLIVHSISGRALPVARRKDIFDTTRVTKKF